MIAEPGADALPHVTRPGSELRTVETAHPAEHLGGAVDRRAFLVAGDEQADRAAEIAAAAGDEALARQCYANALRAARGEDVAWITIPSSEVDPLRRLG